MLYVNEHNDELFRRAAENYPLNTGNGDWEALRKKMAEWHEPVPEPTKNPYRYLLAFLLIPVFLIPLSLSDMMPERPSHIYINTGKLSANDSIRAAERDPVVAAPASMLTASRGNTSPVPVTGLPGFNYPPQTVKIIDGNQFVYNNRMKTSVPLPVTAPVTEDIKQATGNDNNRSQPVPLPTPSGVNAATAIAPAVKDKPRNELPDKNLLAARRTGVNEKEKDTKQSRHFYAGVIAGPDISMVKMQEVKKAGYGFGLLVGYRLNKHWAVESGVLWSKKNYSTDGKYFNTKNIALPNYAEILYAEGICQMIEIPLNIRYRFNQQEQHAWSASAGVSGYFMKKESYDYSVVRYGNRYPRSAEYRNSSSDLVSVVNLGAGYTRQLGRRGDLRIEPYIKIPVKKTGIGNLPLQSAGIYLGYTRSIF